MITVFLKESPNIRRKIMRFLSTFSQIQPLILKKVFTRAWTNRHTADSCVHKCVVFAHAYFHFTSARFWRQFLIKRTTHTRTYLPELRREGEKKDVDTGSDDGRAQEKWINGDGTENGGIENGGMENGGVV